MDIPIGALNLTLVEAAIRQTDAAIDALQRGDYDIALTLAGAAEGMMQRPDRHMFSGLRDSPKARAIFSKDEWITIHNRERDWLKHGGCDTMEIDCAAAAFMIARVAAKLEVWTPKIDEFKIWLINNLDAI